MISIFQRDIEGFGMTSTHDCDEKNCLLPRTLRNSICMLIEVCCISALGLQKIQRNSDDGIFREPLRRIEGSHLTIENAFDAYVIFGYEIYNHFQTYVFKELR